MVLVKMLSLDFFATTYYKGEQIFCIFLIPLWRENMIKNVIGQLDCVPGATL